MKTAIYVAVAGAAGAAASLLMKVATDYPLGSLGTSIAVVILGIGAAFIGVYLIGNSDRRDLGRCLVFAFICGVSWKAMYDASGIYLKTVSQESQALKHVAAAGQLEKDLESSSTTPVDKVDRHVQDLSNSVVTATQKLPDVGTPAAENEVHKATKGAINSIYNVALRTPVTASEALANVGAAAAAKGDTANANFALTQLNRLQQSRTLTDAQRVHVTNQVSALRVRLRP